MRNNSGLFSIVLAALMHPDMRQVIPLVTGAVRNTDSRIVR